MKRILVLSLMINMSLTIQGFGQSSWTELNEKNVIEYLNTYNPNGVISNGEIKDVSGMTYYQSVYSDVIGNRLYHEYTMMIFFLNGSPVSYSYGQDIKELKTYGRFSFMNENGFSEFNKSKSRFNNEKLITNSESEFKTKWLDTETDGIVSQYSGKIEKLDKKWMRWTEIHTQKMEMSSVIDNEKNGLVGGKIKVSELNYFDIKSLIDVFISDLVEYSKKYFKENFIGEKDTKSYFEFLKTIQLESILEIDFDLDDEGVLGLSKSIYDDSTISISFNPIEWKISSIPKKLYVLYHELGHDVLNFKHGEGGKMMFTISDSDYNLKDFYDDREYMFDVFIDNKLNLGMETKTIEKDDVFLSEKNNLLYYKNLPFNGRTVHLENTKQWIVIEYKSGSLNGIKCYDFTKEKLLYEMDENEVFTKFNENGFRELVTFNSKDENGIEITTEKYFFDNGGPVKLIRTKRNGELDGPQKVYNENGELMGIYIYEDGLIKERQLWENGKFIKKF